MAKSTVLAPLRPLVNVQHLVMVCLFVLQRSIAVKITHLQAQFCGGAWRADVYLAPGTTI